MNSPHPPHRINGRLLAITLGLLPLVQSGFAGVSIAPLTTFSTDGWISSSDDAVVGAGGGNVRGLTYNPVTENILVATRAPVVKSFDRTGTFVADLNVTGLSGGDVTLSCIVAGDDGAIYGNNVRVSPAAGTYKVYKWTSEGAAPTVYYESSTAAPISTARLGDSLNAWSDTTGILLGTGENSAAANGFVLVDHEAEVRRITFPGSPAPAPGDFKFGIAFKDRDNVFGSQGPNLRLAAVTGSTATLTATRALSPASKRGMDYAVVGGVPLVAIMDTGNSKISLWDYTDPLAPSAAGTEITTTGSHFANGNGTSAVAWGKVTTNAGITTAELFALNTNNGVQAFLVTVTPDVSPPLVNTSPASRTVYVGGQTTFTVEASGTPPLSYQWYKDNTLIPLATTASFTVKPVSEADVGAYTCRVSNASPTTADSQAANLATLPSLNTPHLTSCWRIAAGSRAYLSNSLDFQRGMDANPTSDRLYVVNRAPLGVAVLSTTDGADVATLDVTGIAGGQSGFALNMIGVADDGPIYGANLSATDTGADYKIYKWADDQPATVPTNVYIGNPISSRIGDTLDVRGSGAGEFGTQLLAGSRNTKQFVIFTLDENTQQFVAKVFLVDGVTDGAFGLGCSFGRGDTVWGKAAGGALVEVAFNFAAGTAQLVRSIPTSAVPATLSPIAIDPVRNALIGVHRTDSDHVRLYRLPSVHPDATGLTLLDMEFLGSDFANGNGVGSVSVKDDKVFILNTNNGLECMSITMPELRPVILNIVRNGPKAEITFMGTAGKRYLVEKSTDLSPLASWVPDGSLFMEIEIQMIERTIPTGSPRLFWRLREEPLVAQ